MPLLCVYSRARCCKGGHDSMGVVEMPAFTTSRNFDPIHKQVTNMKTFTAVNHTLLKT